MIWAKKDCLSPFRTFIGINSKINQLIDRQLSKQFISIFEMWNLFSIEPKKEKKRYCDVPLSRPRGLFALLDLNIWGCSTLNTILSQELNMILLKSHIVQIRWLYVYLDVSVALWSEARKKITLKSYNFPFKIRIKKLLFRSFSKFSFCLCSLFNFQWNLCNFSRNFFTRCQPDNI